MTTGHDSYRRFGLSACQVARTRAALPDMPPLPVVDYAALGQTAPVLLDIPAGTPPKAYAIVITSAEAEWAAMQQVFCQGATEMPYADRTRGSWPGWEAFTQDLPANAPSGWTGWGSYRLVGIAGKPVLLFKSNTHLDYPGASFLQSLIALLIRTVQPTLILSIGTAGGAVPADHVGTVRAVSAGTLYEAGQPAADWPDYRNNWTANDALLGNPALSRLLLPIPTSTAALQTLAAALNKTAHADYTLAQLDPDGLNLADAQPMIHDQTGGATSLLTTSTFVVGTTAGDFAGYSAIEMDDAVIGQACAAAGTAFGFVRNISDPVQNASLPAEVQADWGSAVYDAYGFYTSYNGAVAAWAILAAPE